MRRSRWLGTWLLILGWTSALRAADDFAFFEAKIRPVLVKECYACHSADAKKIRGGLKLDTRADMLAGGDSGPSVVPGKPDDSPILAAIQHDGLAMPPKGKLADAIAADFAQWIKAGAPDPRVGTASTKPKTGIDLEAGRKFWAYQPLRHIDPPALIDQAWPQSEIDRYVLAGLEAKGIRPAADADKPTLIRRLTFDLIGLPPTPEEIDTFVNDTSQRAYENLVDRLLASPRFGERWGRHWLDVVRFAESLTLRGFIFKEAWRYRDYVIDSFNVDRPFDQFVREQVAGDLLASDLLDDRRRGRVATTFLMLGNTNLEEQDKKQLDMDLVDEQVDTLGKAFLAQTIGCARCHDHKFDPIPTKDYYAIAGIFKNVQALEHSNVSKWLDVPLPVSAEEETQLQAHESTLATLEAKLKAERSKGAGKNTTASGIVAIADLPGIVVDDSQAMKVGEWKVSQFSKSYVGDGYSHDLDTDKGTKTLTFQPALPRSGEYEVWLAYVPGDNRAKVPVTVFGADGEKTITVDMKKIPPIDGRFLSLGKYKFEKDGQTFVLLANEGTTGHVIADAVIFLPTDLELAIGRKSQATTTDMIKPLEAELKAIKARMPRREMAMSVRELPTTTDVKVHIRGSVHNLGEVAPRGFLQVATSGTAKPLPTNQSGRRELADWLTATDNPLTARVFVNRAWHWLFGAGLVRTVDNFGTTGEAPSHLELLDDLALGFINDGWSVKRLVKRIVLSHTYRLGSIRRCSAARRRRSSECDRDASAAARS